ncbi:hypothetical protein B0H19DRAFT_1229324 [Mycena capillaripes]|nr:hypothetical protein B0H19DRAFT_1229324 [Mycena capillaripes]
MSDSAPLDLRSLSASLPEHTHSCANSDEPEAPACVPPQFRRKLPTQDVAKDTDSILWREDKLKVDTEQSGSMLGLNLGSAVLEGAQRARAINALRRRTLDEAVLEFGEAAVESEPTDAMRRTYVDFFGDVQFPMLYGRRFKCGMNIDRTRKKWILSIHPFRLVWVMDETGSRLKVQILRQARSSYTCQGTGAAPEEYKMIAAGTLPQFLRNGGEAELFYVSPRNPIDRQRSD